MCILLEPRLSNPVWQSVILGLQALRLEVGEVGDLAGAGRVSPEKGFPLLRDFPLQSLYKGCPFTMDFPL